MARRPWPGDPGAVERGMRTRLAYRGLSETAGSRRGARVRAYLTHVCWTLTLRAVAPVGGPHRRAVSPSFLVRPAQRPGRPGAR